MKNIIYLFLLVSICSIPMTYASDVLSDNQFLQCDRLNSEAEHSFQKVNDQERKLNALKSQYSEFQSKQSAIEFQAVSALSSYNLCVSYNSGNTSNCSSQANTYNRLVDEYRATVRMADIVASNYNSEVTRYNSMLSAFKQSEDRFQNHCMDRLITEQQYQYFCVTNHFDFCEAFE